jgi:hypothetical protein
MHLVVIERRHCDRNSTLAAVFAFSASINRDYTAAKAANLANLVRANEVLQRLCASRSGGSSEIAEAVSEPTTFIEGI